MLYSLGLLAHLLSFGGVVQPPCLIEPEVAERSSRDSKETPRSSKQRRADFRHNSLDIPRPTTPKTLQLRAGDVCGIADQPRVPWWLLI